MRLANLIIERATDGTILLSWTSLDDGSPRRVPFPSINLDPVWNEFDSGYLDATSSHFFALSPRLGSPVEFVGSAPSLGTLDSAMIADFVAALPSITDHVANSVAAKALYNPASLPEADRAFYRVTADWTIDSDGDGRLDWQELVLDGNNPFAADSDGDGVPDQDPALGAGPGPLPTPVGAEGPTPFARIEKQMIWSSRDFTDDGDPETENPLHAYASGNTNATPAQIDALKDASTYQSFRSAVDQLPWSAGWHQTLFNFLDYQGAGSSDPQHWDWFGYSRTRFRLKLDAPAPPGGYMISFRIVIARKAIAGSPAEGADPAYADILLECPEGMTEGLPVEFVPPAIAAVNEKLIFVPLSVSVLTEVEGAPSPTWEIPSDGACVTSSEPILLDCGNVNPKAHFDDPGDASTDVFWYMRKLNGNGTFKQWELIHDPTQFDPNDPMMTLPLRGPSKSVVGIHGGIYQLRAELWLPDGTKIGTMLTRMRDGRSIVDSLGNQNALLVAGQPDYFGVCEGPLPKTLRNAAAAWLGATGYSQAANVVIEPGNPFHLGTRGDPKCNIFVTHIANSVGATTPTLTESASVFSRPKLPPLWPRKTGI